MPKEDALVPYVDADDIADVVVESLLDDKHIGQTYELTGPRKLTFRQIAKEISKGTGRDIRFNAISMDEHSKILRKNQVPEDLIWLMNYLFKEVLVEKNSSVTNDIEKVLEKKVSRQNCHGYQNNI